VAVVYMFMST